MNFNLIQTDPSSSARAGSFRTEHGTIETPIFMPVGTAATVNFADNLTVQFSTGIATVVGAAGTDNIITCLLYTSPSPRD